MGPLSDKDLADTLKGGQAYLARTVRPRTGPPPARTTDIELPNESGITDPTIATRQQTRKEQPRSMASNVSLRRSMLGGRR